MLTPSRVSPVVLVMLVIGCGEPPTDPLTPPDPSSSQASSRVNPDASFDWTVPARFGADRDGDGLIDYPHTAEARNPVSWPVDLDACGISGTRYDWFVDRRPVARVGTCEYRHPFAAEGRYDVAVHVTGAAGSSVWAERVVTVQDWLIISFGDSYASGEGVPEIPQANDALIQSLEALFADLEAARTHRDAAWASLQDALEAKGLAQDILDTARNRRQDFLAACSDITDWNDVKSCADFLAARALSFELFADAREHFDDAVENAEERLEDAQAAFDSAQTAFNAAVSAVEQLRAAIAAAQTGFTDPVWQPPFVPDIRADVDGCHRSANAAPARAALALERADPRTSVTFVHLACSGAKVEGVRDEQIPRAETMIGNREIDAVLLSIGGNDAGFAHLALACGTQEHCFVDEPLFNPGSGSLICPFLELVGEELGRRCTERFGAPTASAKTTLEEGLAKLPGRYESLATSGLLGLSGLLAPAPGGPGRDGRGRPASIMGPTERVRSQRVYIAEYVDMTRDDDASYCDLEAHDFLGNMPGFTLPEMEWLDVTAAAGINEAVGDAADAHGWNFVTGIQAGYRTHGYCAEAHWVVRGHETFLIQGDPLGIAHPNVAGHAFNGAAIHAALERDLYPAGLEGAPRAPDQPREPAEFSGRTH